MTKQKVLTSISALILLAIFLVFFLPPVKTIPFEMTNVTARLQVNPARNYSGALMVNLDEDADTELFVSVISDKNIFFKRQGKELVPMKIPELEESTVQTFSVTACDLTGDGRDELLLINSGSGQNKVMSYKNRIWTRLPSKENLSGAYSATCVDRKGNNIFGLAVVFSNGTHQYLEWKDNEVKDVAPEIGFNLKSEARSVIGIPGPLGRTNLFVSGKDANFFFVNKGDGTFEEKARELGMEDKEFEGRGSSLIDLNHDENIDLVYGNHLGPIRVLEQTNTGEFKNVTPDILASNYAVNAVVVDDFNLDGYEDLYLNNIRHKNGMFLRSGNNWTEIDLKENNEKDLYGVSSVVADFDKDGSVEILNTHGDGNTFPLTLYSIKPESNSFRVHPVLMNGGVPRGTVIKIRTSKRTIIKAVNTGSGRFANYDDVIAIGLLKDETVLSLEAIKTSGEKVIKSEKLIQNGLNEFSF